MRSAIAFFLCAVSLGAGAAEFSYKGVRLGDTVEVVREKLPTYKCSSAACEYEMRRCVDQLSRNDCDASASFGGAWVRSGRLTLLQGRVVGVKLQFNQPMVTAAADAAAQAFGPPSSETTGEVHTKAGLKLDRWVKRWNSGDQVLTISQRVGDVETGMAELTSLQAIEAEARVRKQRAAAGAKDF